jgi:pimeloyl-ACP methyl ester carboxylesterase
LCHGFSYNGTFFDLTPDASFARYLANEGFDVWVVNLRGAGQSSRWALTMPAGGDAILGRIADQIDGREIPRYGFVSLDPKYANWSFDDHVDHDIPAILSLVKHRTNRPQVAWVGHSMGGNIMLAYLAKYGQDASVGRLITIGSQMWLPPESAFSELLLALLKQRQREVAGNGPVLKTMSAGANHMFFNVDNMDPAAFRAIETTGQDAPSVGVLDQYLTLCSRGEMFDFSKRTPYAPGLRNVTCPYLIVAGDVDSIAPPYLQERLLQAVSSEDRTLLVMGRRSGFAVDYGHGDAIVCRKAQADVYPVLKRWLDGQPVGLTSPR